ncbi:hypothetical protein DPEC_G00201830 [Dallia pectoralis]|uniref:Uncharacterized protein n=1 Tax=Dallia pectoralis TaxID=75939 RepID=A0ACC2G984_DALPE|nr:hypothetical protein DPEC_G00201830 [Dallia pectoralis]
MMMMMQLVCMVVLVGAQGSIARKACDQCPPGTYLRHNCDSTHRSDCAECPEGSFTEYWNRIPRCLRCRSCDVNQVVTQGCSPKNDCQCECIEGYFFNSNYEACVRHTECMPGYGANVTGTPHQDTECVRCEPGSYSHVFSAKLPCIAHKKCDADGLQVVLKGTDWHDTLCASCQDLITLDGAKYMRDILPAFCIQIQQKMRNRKMSRLVMKLQQLGGERTSREEIMKLSNKGLERLLNSWVQGAGDEQVRRLPDVLTQIGAGPLGERLQRKMDLITHQRNVCNRLID